MHHGYTSFLCIKAYATLMRLYKRIDMERKEEAISSDTLILRERDTKTAIIFPVTREFAKCHTRRGERRQSFS